MSARRVVPLRSGPAAAAAPSVLNAARDAFLTARFDLVAAYLAFDQPKSTAESGRLQLLRANLARATNDHPAAVEAGTVASRDHPTLEGRLSAMAIAAAAARTLGDADEAQRLFARVRKAVQSETSDETALPAYLLAVDAWHRRDYAEAERVVAPFLELEGSSAFANTLSGWMAVTRREYRAAGSFFGAALADTEDVSKLGVWHRAGIVYATAMVAVETADVRLGKRARKAYEAIEWTESLAGIHIRMLMSLRDLALLEGDLDRAWFLARQETLVARTPAYQIMAEVDHATCSRLIGDDRGSRLELRRAADLIRAERWGNASEEDRLALSYFASEAARDLPAEARHAITLYQSLRAKRQPQTTLDEDGRVDAFTYLAIARVDEAMGERGRAIEHYRQALEIAEESGQTFRYAVTLADLFRLTRNEEYRTALDEALKRAPRAWLLTSRSPADELGPKAREILARLLVGESAKTVAAELGRSTFTVSNHTRRIFEVFEVHSRDELREKCAELGITPVTLRAR